MFNSPTTNIIGISLKLSKEILPKQTQDFWDKQVKPRLQKGKIGIICPSYLMQAKQFYLSYQTGRLNEVIINKEQDYAKFILIIIKNIQDERLQDQVHFLPIPTYKINSSKASDDDNFISLEDLNTALGNIAKHIGAGFQVIGLTDTPYYFLSDTKPKILTHSNDLSNWLTIDKIRIVVGDQTQGHYSQETNANNFNDNQIAVLSQGQYIWQQLDFIKKLSPNIWPRFLREAFIAGQQKPKELAISIAGILRESEIMPLITRPEEKETRCCPSCRII